MAKSFADQVGAWAKDVPEALDVVLKGSLEELDETVKQRTPVDTGFLRNSWMASTVSMPALTRGEVAGSAPAENTGSIASAKFGQPFYFGYTANYAAHVEYGRRGRSGVGMVRLAVQQWPQIVDAAAKEAKARLKT